MSLMGFVWGFSVYCAIWALAPRLSPERRAVGAVFIMVGLFAFQFMVSR